MSNSQEKLSTNRLIFAFGNPVKGDTKLLKRGNPTSAEQAVYISFRNSGIVLFLHNFTIIFNLANMIT